MAKILEPVSTSKYEVRESYTRLIGNSNQRITPSSEKIEMLNDYSDDTYIDDCSDGAYKISP